MVCDRVNAHTSRKINENTSSYKIEPGDKKEEKLNS